MSTTYKLLLCGKNHLIIDEFYENIEHSFDLLTASPRFSDLVRHIELFKPDMIVYCLYNETSDDYMRARELQRHMNKVGAELAITGSQDECDQFQKNTNGLAKVVLARPLRYEVIRGSIYARMLDREHEKEEENGRMDEEVNRIQQEAAAIKRQHVLVIDDDPLMLKLLKEYLHENYDVATAISGKIAYKFLESKTTDLILLDYEMPGESGPQVFQKLRANSLLDGVPIVFLTGVTDTERVREVLSLKPQGYLLKPVDKEKLTKKVADIFAATK